MIWRDALETMGRALAHRLFSQLSEDLATINAKYRGLVGCPLCLSLFAESAIDLEPSELTDEHIIPRELGGNINTRTLTCKCCNNVHGSKLDAHLIQMLRSRDSIEGLGNRSLHGRIKVGDITVPTDIDWKASVGRMSTFGLRRFNPVQHEAMKDQLTSGSVKTINVSLNFDFIPGRANIALLRIAYLTMFREFGYSYILSQAASIIREIINSFQKYPAEIGQFVGEVGIEPGLLIEPVQLLKVRDGIAVMVVMTLVTETKRYYATFMPSPELVPESVITTLCDAAKSVTRRPPAEAQCA
jgi:hypothetical protein